MEASMFRLIGPFAAYLLAASCLIERLGDAYTWPLAIVLALGAFIALVIGSMWMEAKP